MAALFELGLMTATAGALAVLTPEEPFHLFARHASGDWGEVPAEDARENELSVERGFRVVSAYTTISGARVWVITEADRSATTILLPEEY
jgi:hypothetical protein